MCGWGGVIVGQALTLPPDTSGIGFAGGVSYTADRWGATLEGGYSHQGLMEGILYCGITEKVHHPQVGIKSRPLVFGIAGAFHLPAVQSAARGLRVQFQYELVNYVRQSTAVRVSGSGFTAALLQYWRVKRSGTPPGAVAIGAALSLPPHIRFVGELPEYSGDVLEIEGSESFGIVGMVELGWSHHADRVWVWIINGRWYYYPSAQRGKGAISLRLGYLFPKALF